MLKTHGLHTYVLNNNLKSLGLLAGFVLVVQLMFAAIWSASCLFFFPIKSRADYFAKVLDLTIEFAPGVMIGSLVWAFLAFLYYKSILRGMTGLNPTSRMAEPRLYNIVENLAIVTGLPCPRIEISESPKLNAFAMGLTPTTSSIGVTRGLLRALNDRELEAVIAHELTHIRTLDVRLMTVATIFCGIIFSIGWFLTYRAREVFRQMKTKPIVIVPALIWVGAMSMVLPGGFPWHAPILTAGLILSALAISLGLRFAMSRTREYVADIGACELTKNPEALISALAKIHGRNLIPHCDPTVQAMMISAPSEGLFSSHPELEDRIDAIVAYAASHLNGLRLAPASARVLPPADAGEAQSSFSITKMKYPAWVSKPLIVLPALAAGAFTVWAGRIGISSVADKLAALPANLVEVINADPRTTSHVGTFSSTSKSMDQTQVFNGPNGMAGGLWDFIGQMSPGDWKIMMIYGFIGISMVCGAKLLRSYGFDTPFLRQLSGGPSKEMESDWETEPQPEETRINAAIARVVQQQSSTSYVPPVRQPSQPATFGKR